MARNLSVFSSLMWNYSFHNNFCQKIIIYLESLLIVQAFQIYNYLLTEIIMKRIISHQWREHWLFSRHFVPWKSLFCQDFEFIFHCQKIIIYLESLYNKLYFDIKFISKYWKMNSKSWQDELFHGTKWQEIYQCSLLWCEIILFIIKRIISHQWREHWLFSRHFVPWKSLFCQDFEFIFQYFEINFISK
jgi:hypothetical protein